MADLVHAPWQHEITLMHSAADEIERLKAINAELLEALKGMVRDCPSSASGQKLWNNMAALEQARAAIEKAARP